MGDLVRNKLNKVHKEDFIGYIMSLGCHDILPLVAIIDFPLTCASLQLLMGAETSNGETNG